MRRRKSAILDERLGPTHTRATLLRLAEDAHVLSELAIQEEENRNWLSRGAKSALTRPTKLIPNGRIRTHDSWALNSSVLGIRKKH